MFSLCCVSTPELLCGGLNKDLHLEEGMPAGCKFIVIHYCHFLTHSDDVSCTRTITLLWIFWSYFPLIICNAIACPLYNLILVRGISTKLHKFVKQIQTTCRAQEP